MADAQTHPPSIRNRDAPRASSDSDDGSESRGSRSPSKPVEQECPQKATARLTAAARATPSSKDEEPEETEEPELAEEPKGKSKGLKGKGKSKEKSKSSKGQAGQRQGQEG